MGSDTAIPLPDDAERKLQAEKVAKAFTAVAEGLGTMAHQVLESFTRLTEALVGTNCGETFGEMGPCLLRIWHGHDHLSAHGNGVKAWH